ncbi:CpaB family protein [Flexivirga lutea]
MESRRHTAADELPTPAAHRLQRPSWRDSRLVVGVLLVLVATIGGAAALRHYDNSIEVLQAAHPLVPGQRVAASDVHAVKVRIDKADGTYLRADDPLPTGEVLREVRSGELVPRSAVGAGGTVRVKAVALPVDAAQSANLVKGSIVDVWISPQQQNNVGKDSYAAPTRLINRAVVARVPGKGGGFSVASDSGAVHVLVPDDKVAAVLGAVNQGAKVDLVPAAGSPLKGD